VPDEAACYNDAVNKGAKLKTKLSIKTWGGTLLFEYEAGDNTLKRTLEAAVKSRADLSGADLSGADLSRANLFGANLSGADLSGADLSRANLSRADLFGAYLSRANLSRANLFGANLSRANLFGANLSGADLFGADLSRAKGLKDILQIGPIGSRKSYLLALKLDDGKIEIKTGCFSGTIGEFEEQVREKHKDNEHGEAYKMAVSLIKLRFGL